MIHAFLYINGSRSDHSYHGPKFKDIMNTINSSSVIDPQRPSNGYNITVYHNFDKEIDSLNVYYWLCKACGDLIKSVMNREPSANDCTGHKGTANFCRNMSCPWHMHKKSCSGRYTKISEPPVNKGKKRISEDEHEGDGEKSKRLPFYATRQATKRLPNKEVLKNKSVVQDAIKVRKLFPAVVDAAESSGKRFPSGDNPHSWTVPKSKQLKAIEPKNECIALDSGIPKRLRTLGCKTKPKYNCREDKKPKQEKRVIAVTIPGLEYYEDEESEEEIEPLINKRTKKLAIAVTIPGLEYYENEEPEEEIEPLINKRTKRRKMQKLLREQGGRRSSPMTAIAGRREAYVGSSQLKSPSRNDIVYISDSDD